MPPALALSAVTHVAAPLTVTVQDCPLVISIEIDTNVGNQSIQGDQPRTGIGMIDAKPLVAVVADGRSAGYSRGVTMTEFADIFVGLGARVAYDLDGGGSSRNVLRLVLGGRRFTGQVPARCRIGKAVGRRVFRALTGVRLHDTQAGLRGYPAGPLTWLGGVEGDRFEYEANVSGTPNFKLNRDLVFADRADARAPLRRYVALAAALLAADHALLDLLVGTGVPLAAAKLVVEALLFTTSYVVQHRTVFLTPASARARVAHAASTAPEASVVDASVN